MRGWKPEIDTDLKSGTKIEWEEVIMILTLNKNKGRSTFHQTLVSYLGKGEELADRQGDRWVWQPWRWVAQVTIHWRKGNTSPFLGESFQVDLELTLISENLKCQYGPPLRMVFLWDVPDRWANSISQGPTTAKVQWFQWFYRPSWWIFTRSWMYNGIDRLAQTRTHNLQQIGHSICIITCRYIHIILILQTYMRHRKASSFHTASKVQGGGLNPGSQAQMSESSKLWCYLLCKYNRVSLLLDSPNCGVSLDLKLETPILSPF